MARNVFCFIGISLVVGVAYGRPGGPHDDRHGGPLHGDSGVVQTFRFARHGKTLHDGGFFSQSASPQRKSLQADGKVTGFALPNPNSGPTTIAIAPDGTLWFTEGSGNRIGRMAPDGTGIKEFDLPHAGSAPRIITIGSDGNFWFSEHLGNRIGRITPAGVISEFDIPTPDSQPRATALGRDGNVWFGEFVGGKIGRMTLAGQVTEFTLPGADRGPGDITAGADGNMWFVELNGRADNRAVDGNRVGRITEFPMPNATGSPVNIAVGPDRNIWYTKGNRLGRVTPEGVITEFDVPGGGTGLTAGSDRAPVGRLVDKLWIAQSGANKIAYMSFK